MYDHIYYMYLCTFSSYIHGAPKVQPRPDQDMRNRELNNGRFAMVSILGILAAELVTGKDAVQQLGF